MSPRAQTKRNQDEKNKILTPQFIENHMKYFYQIQFQSDTDTGYSNDEQTYSFIRWSLSQNNLQKLANKIHSSAKQIEKLIGETILEKGILNIQFWQEIYKILEIDYKHTHLSVLRDVRSLVTIMCQVPIKKYTEEFVRQKKQ